MTIGPPAARRRRRVGRAVLVAVAALALAALTFLLGVGLGQALEETPPPGGVRTHVRTLETVTVTVEP